MPLETLETESILAPLAETLCQTLETMAFVCPEPCPPDVPAPGEPVRVSMGFRGPITGTVCLVVDRAFGRHLASNVLEPGEEVETKVDDTLRELINVVVGALMPRLARSENDVFNLTLPKVEPFDPKNWADFAQHSARVFDADGFNLAIRVDLD